MEWEERIATYAADGRLDVRRHEDAVAAAILKGLGATNVSKQQWGVAARYGVELYPGRPLVEGALECLYAFWRDTPFPRVSFSLLEGGDRAALLRFADIEPETDRTLCVLGAERGRVRAEDQRMWLWLHPETFGRVCPQFPPPFGVLAGEGGTFVVKTDIIGALRALNRRRHEQEQDG